MQIFERSRVVFFFVFTDGALVNIAEIDSRGAALSVHMKTLKLCKRFIQVHCTCQLQF